MGLVGKKAREATRRSAQRSRGVSCSLGVSSRQRHSPSQDWAVSLREPERRPHAFMGHCHIPEQLVMGNTGGEAGAGRRRLLPARRARSWDRAK